MRSPRTPWGKVRHCSIPHLRPWDEHDKLLRSPPRHADYAPPVTDPHHNLLIAVLIDAIQSAILGDQADRRWLLSDSQHEFSSAWICDLLEINRIALLERINREWETIRINGMSPYYGANPENVRNQTHRVGGNSHRVVNRKPWPALEEKLLNQKLSDKQPE